MDKGADLFDAELSVRTEFYPDGADVGDGIGVGGCGKGSVFVVHGLGGAGREIHASATARK